MRRHLLLGGVLAVACVVAAVPGSAAADSPSGLEFVQPDSVKLKLAGSGEMSKPVSVWLQNTTTNAVEPAFSVEAEDADGKAAPGVTVAPASGSGFTRLPAARVSRYRIVVRNIAKSNGLSGQLVAFEGGSSTRPVAAPATVALDYTPAVDYGPKTDLILILAAVAAIALVAIRWLTLKAAPRALLKPADVDFSTGVAATLTVVGALLGGFVSADVLPEKTQHLSKDAYTALNVIFGALIAVGALAFGAVQKQQQGKDGAAELHGYVLGLMLASTLTAAAAFGELATLYYLVADVDETKGFTAIGTTTLQGLVVVSAVGMAGYLWVRIGQMVKPAPSPEGEAAAAARVDLVASVPTRRMPRLPL